MLCHIDEKIDFLTCEWNVFELTNGAMIELILDGWVHEDTFLRCKNYTMVYFLIYLEKEPNSLGSAFNKFR